MNQLPGESSPTQPVRPKGEEPSIEKQVEALYETYYRPIFQRIKWRVRSTEVAEDLVQDTFGVLVRRLSESDVEIQNMSAYLWGIANNMIARYWERSSRHVHDDLESVPSNVLEVQPRASDRLLVSEAAKHISSMPEVDQVILKLRLAQQADFGSIASATGLKPPAVRQRFQRARRKLLQLMGFDDVIRPLGLEGGS